MATDTITIRVTAPGRSLRLLHRALLSRLNDVESCLESRSSPGDRLVERRNVLENLVDAINTFFAPRQDDNTFAHTVGESEAVVLRDELLDMYGAIRPFDVERVLDADVNDVFVLLLGYSHRLVPCCSA